MDFYFMFNNTGVGLCSLAILVALVNYYNSLRDKHYITRSAVLEPDQSPWNKILHDGDDVSFLNLTGFTKPVFYELVHDLFPNLNNPPESRKRGRPAKLDEYAKTGLYLYFCNSKMEKNIYALYLELYPQQYQGTSKK